MLIREILCELDHGLMLFQVQLPDHEDASDNFLRSSLISTLYSFVSQIEEDTINALQMTKVTFMFRKRDDLIFMLALDSTINPARCEAELEYLIQKFFKTFPEAQWQGEVALNLRIFDTFKEEVKKHLVRLNTRLELGTMLLNGRLITDDDFLEREFEVLGSVVAQRLFQSYQLAEPIQQRQNVLVIVDKILDSLNGSHIEREATHYVLDCDVCLLCHSPSDCFFETFLNTILSHLHFKITISQYRRRRTLKWRNSGLNDESKAELMINV